MSGAFWYGDNAYPEEGEQVPRRADRVGHRHGARDGGARRGRGRATRTRCSGCASGSCATGRGPRVPSRRRSRLRRRLARGRARRDGAGDASSRRSSPRRPRRRSTRSPPTGVALADAPAANARGPTAATADPRRIPRTLSASALIDHALCPKRFYWTRVRPLPRFSGPAARIGTEIHRWIERRARGPGPAARGRRRRRPHPGGTRRRPGPGRAAAPGVPRVAVRRADAAVRRARVPAARRRRSRSAAGSTRSTARPTAPGRSSTGRPASARPTRSSSSSTGSRASRSGTSGPRSSPSPTTTWRGTRPCRIPMGDPAEVRARVAASLEVDRGRGVRADARPLVRVLRLQELLRRREGLARRTNA